MRRRAFFAAPVASAPADLEELADFPRLRVSRRAMATQFEIAIPYGTPNALEAAEDALDLIDQLESQLTVYRDDSELSLINAGAFREAVPVEATLFELLKHCAALHQTTRGAFDIASGRITQAWGFHRREGRIPFPAERAEALKSSGMRHVVLNDHNRSVKFLREGLLLNLGSIGKGYALDRAAERLWFHWGIRSALLSAGGSSLLAVNAPPDDSRGWSVAVTHPSNDGSILGTVRLRSQALGTSAATFQRFEYNGRSYGHVIDPRSGMPAEGIASASAVAPTAAEADAFATAFFVLDPLESAKIVAAREGLGALILPAGESVTPLRLNLPPGL